MAESYGEVDNALEDFTTNVKLAGLRTSLKLVKTMLGDVTEKKVTFCFDISGSMYRVFNHFREHLLETLFKMLLSNRSQKFNIVFFNSSVHQFSPIHQVCTEENIVNVIRWMNKPYYESKSNMLAGLIKSFEGRPDAVYLVTDGFINKERVELLSHLPHISKGRPVKCIMITHTVPPDDLALDFLEDISSITNGTLTVISIQDFGSVEILMPILYAARPIRGRRTHFIPFQETMDIAEMRKYFMRCKGCLPGLQKTANLQGDPMKDLPVIAPFISKDPISEMRCPFYHPYFHWYWPQYWEGKGPSPTLMWTKNDPQYHSMWSDFRDSRSFICGKKYLDTYNEFYNSVSAGIVIINRKVLAINYIDANKFYIGKVTSQVNPTNFLVKFDAYNNFNELQQTDINDIVDLEEQMRHSIKVNDFVIAPLDVLKGSYDIAVVVEGSETKFSEKSLVPPRNSKLKVQFLESKFETYLEFNQSVYISPKLKEHFQKRRLMNKKKSKSISSDESEEYDNTMEKTDDILELRLNANNNAIESDEMKENCYYCYYCNLGQYVCGVCYGNARNVRPSGRVASPVDNGEAKTLEEIDEEIAKNKSKLKESNSEIPKVEENRFDDLSLNDDEEENKDSTIENIGKYDLDSDYEDGYSKRKNKKDTFTETDLNWCILRLLNKHQNANNSTKDKTPWKYWGRKPIPDVIDPPSTEPYKDPSNWGGCPMPKPVINAVEWPNTTFQTINPHVVTDYSPEKMYQVFHHESHKSSQRPKRDACIGTRNNLPPDEYSQVRYERKFKYLQGAYPKLDIKYPNIDSVRPLLSSWHSLNPQGSRPSTDKYLRSVEKDRINCQIQRDESNCLNFLHHKMASTRKTGPLH